MNPLKPLLWSSRTRLEPSQNPLPAGYGILVSSKVKETAASFTVRSPEEVGRFLRGLVDWAETENNGWRTRGDTSLWRAESADVVRRPSTRPLDPQQQKWQAWQNQVSHAGEAASLKGLEGSPQAGGEDSSGLTLGAAPV